MNNEAKKSLKNDLLDMFCVYAVDTHGGRKASLIFKSLKKHLTEELADKLKNTWLNTPMNEASRKIYELREEILNSWHNNQ